MSIAASLPSHFYLCITCAYSLARNWQVAFLNQQKRDNDCRKYFMINLQEIMLSDPVGIEPDHQSDAHYENTPVQIYRKFHLQKTEKFRQKLWYFFQISAQNIDCGYSLEPPNEYPQSMFSSKNKKNNVYPCKPQFYCIQVGFKGVKITVDSRYLDFQGTLWNTSRYP